MKSIRIMAVFLSPVAIAGDKASLEEGLLTASSALSSGASSPLTPTTYWWDGGPLPGEEKYLDGAVVAKGRRVRLPSSELIEIETYPPPPATVVVCARPQRAWPQWGKALAECMAWLRSLW